MPDKEHELVIAARSGWLDVVKGILDKGLVHNTSDKCERALLAAIAASQLDIMKVLLDFGVNPTSKNDGQISICFCAEKGLMAAAKLLLAYKADTNAKTVDGMTAMTIACHNRPPRLEMCKELLRAGARIGPQDNAIGLAQVVKEVQMEKFADDLRKKAEIMVASAEITAVEEQVWKFQREHMRLLMTREEQRTGVMLIDAERRREEMRAEARESHKTEEQLAFQLNEKKVSLQAVTGDVRQLRDDLEDAEKAEAAARAERDKVASELAGQQGFVQAALAEKKESDRLHALSEQARDEAMRRYAEMESESAEARRRKDELQSEIREAEREYRNWMRAKEQAQKLTAQAHQLLGAN